MDEFFRSPQKNVKKLISINLRRLKTVQRITTESGTESVKKKKQNIGDSALYLFAIYLFN